MMQRVCWRCMAQATVEASPQIRTMGHGQQCIAPFSTTSQSLALPVKKKTIIGNVQPTSRGKKQTFTMKKGKPGGSRDVGPRQRKEATPDVKTRRQRLVLSNVNALEVPDLLEFDAANLADESHVGRMFSLPGNVVDQLRAVEAFKQNQNWHLYRRPSVLYRQDTLDLARRMESPSDVQRTLVVGEKGSGKTNLLLQTMTLAFLKGWTVVNIPSARDLVTAQTEYMPVPNSDPATYTQPAYIANLLLAIARANPALHSLQLTQPFHASPEASTKNNAPRPSMSKDMSLAQLAQLGAADAKLAWPVFQALTAELLAPSRPPLLVCIDDLAHIMGYSAYRGPDFQFVHAHQLELVKWILGYQSGATQMGNGGMVLAATSASNKPDRPPVELDIVIQELEHAVSTQQASSSTTPSTDPKSALTRIRDPYVTYDERVFEVLTNNQIGIHRVGGLTHPEARSLLEYWARSGIYTSRAVTAPTVAEEWILSGGGVVGEMERSCVSSRVAYK